MRLGLIGLKGHQNVVTTGAKELKDVEMVAIAEEDPALLGTYVKSEPLAKTAQTYADWRHLVEHAMMDVCCVCDENGRHADQIIALAERNIDIVTEKPLATTLEDLERIRSALAKSKSRMTMLLTMRHEAKYVKMRELIQQGAIGEVCIATSQKSYRLGDRPEWQRHRSQLGGIIPYIGIHAIDLIRWVTGLDFTHVAAFHVNNGKPEMKETEDSASVLLRMSNGASATARLDYLRPMPAPSHGDDRLRVAGGEGVIEVAYPSNEISLVTSKEPPRTIKPGPTPNLFVDFAQAIRDGRPPRIPAEDCLYATEIVLKARDAADEKKMIELKLGS